MFTYCYIITGIFPQPHHPRDQKRDEPREASSGVIAPSFEANKKSTKSGVLLSVGDNRSSMKCGEYFVLFFLAFFLLIEDILMLGEDQLKEKMARLKAS